MLYVIAESKFIVIIERKTYSSQPHLRLYLHRFISIPITITSKMSFLKPSQYGVGISLAVYLQFALVYVFSLALFFLSLLWRSFFYLIRHVGRFMLALGWPQLNVGSTSLIGVPLPAPNSKRYRKKRYKLVLDLDETLVHTSVMKTAHYDLRVEVCGTKGSQVFYVLKRPYVDEFLFEVRFTIVSTPSPAPSHPNIFSCG